MNNRPKNNSTPTSACMILKEILKKPSRSDFRMDFTGVHLTYSREVSELFRAKTACELDMVVSPHSTERNTLFITREEYASGLEKTSSNLEEADTSKHKNSMP